MINFTPRRPCPLYIKRNFSVKLNIQRTSNLFCIEKASSSYCIQEFSANIFPLLMETWIEVMASEQIDKNQGNKLKDCLV